MTPLFLFGTLRHPPLFEIVAGCAASAQDAVLHDARVLQAPDGDWPVLIDAPGARAEGALVVVDDTTLARLDFYVAIFDYERRPVSVATGGLRQAAEIWRPRAAAATGGQRPWDLAAWSDAWGEVTCLAAEEMMRRMAWQSAADLRRVVGIIRARAQTVVDTGRWRRPNRIGTGLGRDAVEIVDRQHPYENFFAIEETQVRFRRFDGITSDPVHRAVFRVADAVTVLPYDPVRDRILLIEQLRFGALVQGDPSPWLLEPIAGLIDAGETAETTARREAVEEAGLDLGALHFISRYYPSPGGLAQTLLSYVGIADLPDYVTGTGGHPGEGEDILSHVVPFDLACRMLEEGDMVNAPLIISMQWLMRNRDRLRAGALG